MSRVFLAAAVVVVFFAPIRLFLLITANFPCGPALGAHIDINCVLLVQFLLVAQLQREREEGTGGGTELELLRVLQMLASSFASIPLSP